MRRNFRNRHNRLLARILAATAFLSVALLTGCKHTEQACIINRCPDVQTPRLVTVRDFIEAAALYKAAYEICNGTAAEATEGAKNE